MLVLCCAVAAALVLFCWLVRDKQRAGEPPLECGVLPGIGVGAEFARDFAGLIARLRARHGDAFTVVNFGQRMTFVTAMPAIRKVWSMGEAFSFVEYGQIADARMGGVSVASVQASGVCSTTLALHAATMRDQVQLEELAQRFRAGLELWGGRAGGEQQPRGRVDLNDMCGELVWFAAGRSLFGAAWCRGTDPRQSYRAFRAFEAQVPLIAGGLPGVLTTSGCRGRQLVLRDALVPAVRAVGRDDATAHPYLANYIAALREAYAGDDEVVARRLMGLLFAIMSNTMGTLFWTMARLQTVPPATRAQVVAEAKAAWGADTYAAAVADMPALNSLILETMRLHTDPNSFRVTQHDCRVELGGGRELASRKGDYVFLLSSFEQMRASTSVPVPGEFDAKRWLPQTSDAKAAQQLLPLPSDQALHVFGGGRHLCPGRHFAMLEVRLAVCFAVAHCEVELADGAAIPPKVVELSAPVNMPKEPLYAHVRWHAVD